MDKWVTSKKNCQSPQLFKISNKRSKTARCHSCGQMGHFKNNCPINNQPNLTKTIYQSNESFCQNLGKTIYKSNESFGQKKNIINSDQVRNFLNNCKKYYKFVLYLNDHTGKEIQIVCLANPFSEYGCRAPRVSSVNNRNPDYSDPIIYSLNNCPYDQIIEVMQRYPNFSKIVCNFYQLTYEQILEELQSIDKLAYTMVYEDKRSGYNLVKYLTIEGESINYVACDIDRKRDNFYRNKIIKLYEKVKNVDTEPLFNNPVDINIIYDHM